MVANILTDREGTVNPANAAGMANKKEVRSLYKERRNGMLPGQVEDLSARICQNILRSRLFDSARFLYAYYPLGNEADVRPVIQEAWRQGKRVAFPKVFGNKMRFFEVTGFEQLSEGTFGVMEPCEEKPADWRSGKKLLVLTPGVAFDYQGNRMGFGKGYYDRHFSGKRDYMMLGVSYELQIAEQIPTGDFDVPMKWIVTENGLTEV